MKRFVFISQLLLVFLLLASSTEAFSAARRVNVRHYPISADQPRTRTEPVICIADKDAGYVELHFAGSMGELHITLSDSYGNVVDEISLDTSIENFAILNILDPEESYMLAIEGERYFGEGLIE
jgi:hypothetical protein